MIERRTFLSTVLAAITTSSINANWLKPALRIGISESMFGSQMNDGEKESMCGVFEIKDRTQCEFEVGSAAHIMKQLNAGEFQLSVMSGLDYAWSKAINQQYCEPVVTTFTSGVRMRACVLVNRTSPAVKLQEIQGCTLAYSERLPQHAFVYLQHAITKLQLPPSKLIKNTKSFSNADEGIESVIDRQTDAVLVDADSWQAFQERKPARSKKLKVLDQSCSFPTAIILYHQPSWNKVKMGLLRAALCLAHQKPYSRQLLNFLGVSKFVLYGKEYEQVVEEVRKEIPTTTQHTFLAQK